MRIMFGTDHPFFPPPDSYEQEHQGDRWRSVADNLSAIEGAYGWSDAERSAVYGMTAAELFDLPIN